MVSQETGVSSGLLALLQFTSARSAHGQVPKGRLHGAGLSERPLEGGEHSAGRGSVGAWPGEAEAQELQFPKVAQWRWWQRKADRQGCEVWGPKPREATQSPM